MPRARHCVLLRGEIQREQNDTNQMIGSGEIKENEPAFRQREPRRLPQVPLGFYKNCRWPIDTIFRVIQHLPSGAHGSSNPEHVGHGAPLH